MGETSRGPFFNLVNRSAPWPKSDEVVKALNEGSPMSVQGLVKKFGVYGLIFFTVKGLLWLIVPAVLVYFGTGNG